MSALLCAVFFASGASALIFETLWFRQAGLALGNSVWATSLVLAGFMGGLALGNALAARYGARLGNPVRAYALAEGAIAITGAGLVYVFPVLGVVLAPVFRPLLDQPWVLNPLRLVTAFLLLLIPSTAMGITLPLLVGALMRDDRRFGLVLGRLYGYNTLGATSGVIVSEMYLVGAYGVRRTALLAGALSLVTAAIALRLSGRPSGGQTPRHGSTQPLESRHEGGLTPWIAAAFLSGFCLLALEVVWFRFLVLFVKASADAFPVMLGIVLAGIGSGGLMAGAWLRRAPDAYGFAATIAFATGLLSVITYMMFPRLLAPLGPSTIAQTGRILQIAAPLMFPVCLLSGIFFTLVGAGLQRDLPSETSAAGLLTFVNTAGAALGSLAAGFVLLPWLGMERSFFLIAAAYGGIGVLLVARATRRRVAYVSAGICLLGMALFPFGSLERRLLPVPINRWAAGTESRVVAVREGLTETLVYFDRMFAGKPISHVLLTNSFSMSTTGYGVRRYQKLYVYWPMAVHPGLKRALLIGYGAGNTAKAMTDSASLESIDVVDLSRDILAASQTVFPNESGHPLRDPRVRVHVEDGRYFMQATDRRFDLITGEPPPPGMSGVENLYTREYFQLMRDRLADGGIVTYWLPLSDLTDVSAAGILRAFCDAFEDCSLWNGSGTNLMLVGTLNARGPASEEQFSRQWNVPAIAAEMKRLGLEQPEQLGALFIGDASYVDTLARTARTLTDDDPRLIEAPFSSPQEATRLFASITDTAAARTRFQNSTFVRRLWPAPLIDRSLPYFEFQHIIDMHMYGGMVTQTLAIDDVHRVLTESPLTAPVLWRLASNADIQQVVLTASPQELDDPLVQFHNGIRLLSERNYPAAGEAFERAAQLKDVAANAFALQVYSLCMARRTADAEDLLRGPWEEFLRQRNVSREAATDSMLPPVWRWMKNTCGLDIG